MSPKREFRGVWIATVNNIDWPSKQGLTSDEQKEELVDLIDFHKSNGINAIIVQVRAAGDALYPSNIAPWSASLSGKQGDAPEPFYDPLKFMIDEAHKRGMEFHAWLNPFRVVSNIQRADLSANHISKLHPEWVLTYGHMKILNPGIPEVREHLTEVIREIIQNYKVDAIHFDDYFYPYPDFGATLKDKNTYYRYRNDAANIHDWRRENINQFIEGIHKLIINEKPMIKFGVSPFGVWRNERESVYGSPTRSGYTCYDHLYADVRFWLQQGWIDYVAPQVYQSTEHKNIPYEKLVDWWSHNTFGKHLYIGHAAYRVGESLENGWRNKEELPKQVRHNRAVSTNGSVMYSSKALKYNKEHLTDSLRNNLYFHPALLPTMPWIDNVPPNAPAKVKVEKKSEGVLLSWEKPDKAQDGDSPNQYIIYSTTNSKNPDINNPADIIAILSADQTTFVDKEAKDIHSFKYLVTSIDKFHNESNAIQPKEAPKKSIYTNLLPFKKETIQFFSGLIINSFQ
ncbi:family 10 glycosylhydrolase [Limibacter armeniacum]|uniref:glycoside hydrolase family 10 protein n=1 Tax=Limibacter armeniacum TaxID=466084 RepID=UPI002FE5A911